PFTPSITSEVIDLRKREDHLARNGDDHAQTFAKFLTPARPRTVADRSRGQARRPRAAYARTAAARDRRLRLRKRAGSGSPVDCAVPAVPVTSTQEHGRDHASERQHQTGHQHRHQAAAGIRVGRGLTGYHISPELHEVTSLSLRRNLSPIPSRTPLAPATPSSRL